MLTSLLGSINNKAKISSFILGVLFSFAFAPFFVWPLNITLAFFAFLIRNTETKADALKIGWLFGFGFYLANLYWISIGVGVYADRFWWAIPISLVCLPAFLAIYSAALSLTMHFLKEKSFYVNNFVCLWIIFEIIRSKLFTGFPWSLVAYSFAFSDSVIQISSVIGSYGLGIIILFSFSSFYYLIIGHIKKFICYFFIVCVMWLVMLHYGKNRLESTPPENTEIKIRMVQPSIEQSSKWSIEKFWEHFDEHKKLSIYDRQDFKPDLIIWPEAAVILEPKYAEVINALRSVVVGTKSILITGGITDNLTQENRKKDKVFASIYAIKETGNLIFDYHKSHLVPFGEYVPYSDILHIHKITPGLVPYSPGKPGFIIKIEDLNLKIKPLLCYEIIFPDEVRMLNKNADLILNLTNDAYYGKSSGPYQHFYIARMRAVENGIPVIRVANNGISGIFDPFGRIIAQSTLNSRSYIDGFIPNKLDKSTIYSEYGNKVVYIYIITSLILAFFLPKKKNYNKL